MSVYTVKGVKYHKGHEGEPLAQCSLLRDGKKVADYSDGDWGGEAQFLWIDRKEPKVERTVQPYHEVVTARLTPEEARLWDHVAGKTVDICKGLQGVEPMVEPMTPDLFVGDLVTEHDIQRQYRLKSKKQTLYRLQGDPEGQYWTVKHSFDLPVKEYLQEKYGTRLAEIINETLGQVAQPRGQI